MSDVTLILERIEHGEPIASEELLPLVYEELRKVAVGKMSHEPSDHTLQATALVHEAYLRLVGENKKKWENSRHFFSAAATAMRRILVERARKKIAQKRGGGLQPLDIDLISLATEEDEATVLFVHEALEKLAMTDPECVELIKLRFFAGVSNKNAASMLGMSERTAKRNWAYAKAWLAAEINDLKKQAS